MNTQYAAGRLRIAKDQVIRIKRTLRGKGKLNVSLGQQVSPDEIIGVATLSSGFRKINLSELLSVPPPEAQKYLTKSLGQRIYRGELLAFKSGTIFGGKRLVISPTDGVLDFLNPTTGELRMTFLPKKTPLPAGVFGIVEAIDEVRGVVVLRAQVSRIYGIFGSGGLRDGILHILNKRDDLIDKLMIERQFDENILVGGSLIFKDAISSAISLGVNGIITGGINAKDYQAIAGGRITFPKKIDNDVGISIVVTEGFGSIPIGEDIFEVLSSYEGKFVALDGNKAVINLPSFESKSLEIVRKTRLPPLEAEADFKDSRDKDLMEVREGMKVRIIGNSFLGEQGKIIALDSSPTLLPSGINTVLVTVATSRRKIQIPVANIEVIL
ncbi:hypothetical protein HYZ05_00075 [Candidatus Daviesbacteria bacterium]|nr:hypothetical protein [Candidatus Daviesbacteria bacterium]